MAERDRIDLRVEPELRALMRRGAMRLGFADNISAFLRFVAIEKLNALGFTYPPPETKNGKSKK